MRILLLILIIASGVKGLSQEIKGQIFDKEKGSTPFVKVYLISDSDTIKTEADIDGKFSFSNLSQSEYKIITSYVGYLPSDSIIELNSEDIFIELTIKVDSTKLPFNTADYAFNANTANRDILNDSISLLLLGGIVTRAITDEDSKFEEKYKVNFLSRGCIRLGEDNEAEYNKVMFEYLDKKYGKKWRKEVRKDVIGL
ncbi:MAG: carboxypeptidase-like regulatory domain-containing protein [Vicingaceae bacterium]